MVSIASAARIQVLSRKIDSDTLEISRLQSQRQQYMSMTYVVQQKYQEAERYLEYGSLTDDESSQYFQIVNNLEPLYYTLSTKDNDLQQRLNILQTTLKQETNEFEELKKAEETQAKRTTPHLYS